MFPITDKVKIYKDEPFTKVEKELVEPDYYYNPDELLFTRRKLIRDGVLQAKIPNSAYKVASYDLYGNLVEVRTGLSSYSPEYIPSSIKRAAVKETIYKDRMFKLFDPKDDDIPEEIEVPIVGIIDEIPFKSYAEMGRYCGVSR